MSHFAEISGSNNTVVRVIKAEQDFINSGKVGDSFNWIQCSYNTKGGFHSLGSGFRKNFPGKGFTYDRTRDAFIAPQPQNFVSSSIPFSEDDDHPLSSYISNYFAQNPSGSIPYILNEDTCRWEMSGSNGA